MDLFIPDMYQKSIYSIDYNKLKDDGIKCLLFDLDNTCIPYLEKEPTPKLIDHINRLKDMDFKVILFSNAPKRRVEPFKNALLVDCCANANKPRKNKFLKILKTFNFDLSEVAIIGDQLITDIYGGNKVGIKTILVNPMSNQDFLGTRILRIFERNKFKKMSKKGILKVGKYYE